MQLPSLAALIATTLAATAHAGCYSGGETWGSDQFTANVAVENMCNSGGIGGTFSQGQTKYRCVQLGGGKKAEFWVQWRGAGTLRLNDGDCKLRLSNEINGCQHGGESVIADWYFRSDPNGGGC